MERIHQTFNALLNAVVCNFNLVYTVYLTCWVARSNSEMFLAAFFLSFCKQEDKTTSKRSCGLFSVFFLFSFWILWMFTFCLCSHKLCVCVLFGLLSLFLSAPIQCVRADDTDLYLFRVLRMCVTLFYFDAYTNSLYIEKFWSTINALLRFSRTPTNHRWIESQMMNLIFLQMFLFALEAFWKKK